MHFLLLTVTEERKDNLADGLVNGGNHLYLFQGRYATRIRRTPTVALLPSPPDRT